MDSQGAVTVDSKGWTIRGAVSVDNKGCCVCGQ